MYYDETYAFCHSVAYKARWEDGIVNGQRRTYLPSTLFVQEQVRGVCLLVLEGDRLRHSLSL
jgi:hypothetical protein